MRKRDPFKYFKTSREIIRLAVMLYVRFPLSLRNVEDLLHERGIDVSHEAVRFWWHRLGPLFAAEIKKRRVAGLRSSRWRWHLDEIFVKISGERHYLWRVLAVLLYPLLGSVFGRDMAQAQTFGIAPDPTAVASLGLIELVKAGRWILPLSIIPVSWCLFSGVTLMTLNAPEGWLLFSALGVWLASRLAAFREPGTND